MTGSPKSLAALVAVPLVIACGAGGASAPASAEDATSALASTIASATESAGTLLCAPNAAQVEACAGFAAGDACTLTATITARDGSAVTRTQDGTCRATLDGAAVACAPNPPAPPAELVEACAAKALGDACDVTAPDGDARAGVCVTARDGATVVCGRAHAPPPPAVEACASLAAGDACSFAGRGDEAVSGVCSLGPAGTGVLACAPARELRPSATAACADLAAGDACTIGARHHPMTGSCVAPADGSDLVCLAACGALDGPFRCEPRGRHGRGP